jgi:hypothetical protein
LQRKLTIDYKNLQEILKNWLKLLTIELL